MGACDAESVKAHAAQLAVDFHEYLAALQPRHPCPGHAPVGPELAGVWRAPIVGEAVAQSGTHGVALDTVSLLHRLSFEMEDFQFSPASRHDSPSGPMTMPPASSYGHKRLDPGQLALGALAEAPTDLSKQLLASAFKAKGKPGSPPVVQDRTHGAAAPVPTASPPSLVTARAPSRHYVQRPLARRGRYRRSRHRRGRSHSAAAVRASRSKLSPRRGATGGSIYAAGVGAGAGSMDTKPAAEVLSPVSPALVAPLRSRSSPWASPASAVSSDSAATHASAFLPSPAAVAPVLSPVSTPGSLLLSPAASLVHGRNESKLHVASRADATATVLGSQTTPRARPPAGSGAFSSPRGGRPCAKARLAQAQASQCEGRAPRAGLRRGSLARLRIPGRWQGQLMRGHRLPANPVFRSPLRVPAAQRRVVAARAASPTAGGSSLSSLSGEALWTHPLTTSRLLRTFYLTEYLTNVCLLKAEVLEFPTTIRVASCLAVACHSLALPPSWIRTVYRYASALFYFLVAGRWPLLTLVLRYRLFGHTVRDLEPCMRVITRAAADVYSNRQVLCGAVTKYERRQRMQVARMHDAAWAAAHDGLVLCAEPPSACAYVRLATEGALREFQRQRLQRPRSAPPAWHHAEPAVAPKATRKRARVELETDFRQLSVAANTTREVSGVVV